MIDNHASRITNALSITVLAALIFGGGAATAVGLADAMSPAPRAAVAVVPQTDTDAAQIARERAAYLQRLLLEEKLS
jgi:hypothetical protein